MFTIIFGIIIFIVVIGLAIAAISLLIYLIPLAILIGISYWIITTWGWLTFFGVIVVLAVIGFIGQYIESREFNKAYAKVRRHFLKYEMADYNDLKQILNSNQSDKLDAILQTFVTEGKVERVYLNQGTLYKWIGPGTFSKGIVRKEITLD